MTRIGRPTPLPRACVRRRVVATATAAGSVPADGGEPTHHLDSASGPRWSPDAGAIAFVTIAEEDAGDLAGSAQLFVRGVEEDRARRLTRVAGEGHGTVYPERRSDVVAG